MDKMEEEHQGVVEELEAAIKLHEDKRQEVMKATEKEQELQAEHQVTRKWTSYHDHLAASDTGGYPHLSRIGLNVLYGGGGSGNIGSV